jgi:hypothetical protein
MTIWSRLNNGACLAGVSAIVLLVAMAALGWFRIESVTAADLQGHVYEHPGSQLVDVDNETGGDVSAGAWKAFSVTDCLLALAAFGALVLVALRARGPGPGAAMVAIGVAGLAGLCLLLLVYRAINPPDLLNAFGIAEPANISLDADISRGAGLFVGILACAGMVVGAFGVMTDDVPS